MPGAGWPGGQPQTRASAPLWLAPVTDRRGHSFAPLSIEVKMEIYAGEDRAVRPGT